MSVKLHGLCCKKSFAICENQGCTPHNKHTLAWWHHDFRKSTLLEPVDHTNSFLAFCKTRLWWIPYNWVMQEHFKYQIFLVLPKLGVWGVQNLPIWHWAHTRVYKRTSIPFFRIRISTCTLQQCWNYNFIKLTFMLNINITIWIVIN